jgi:hypothetical protein
MNHKNLVIDADPWLKRLHSPHQKGHTDSRMHEMLARMRDMRVGEKADIVRIEGPSGTGDVRVELERIRGAFRIEATWRLNFGANAQRRGHLRCEVHLKLLPGRQLAVLALAKHPKAIADLPRDPVKDLRAVALVCRRATALSRWAYHEGERRISFIIEPGTDFTRNRYSMSREPEELAWHREMEAQGREEVADWLLRKMAPPLMLERIARVAVESGVNVATAPRPRRAAV